MSQKRHTKNVKVSQAVAVRIKELLVERKMTLYKLEKQSGVLHGTMSNIMYGRNQGITLTTLIQISNGFGIPVIEFLNSPLFCTDKLDIE